MRIDASELMTLMQLAVQFKSTVTQGRTVGTLELGGVRGMDSVARGCFVLSPGQGLGDVRCGVLQEKGQLTSERWTSWTRSSIASSPLPDMKFDPGLIATQGLA